MFTCPQEGMHVFPMLQVSIARSKWRDIIMSTKARPDLTPPSCILVLGIPLLPRTLFPVPLASKTPFTRTLYQLCILVLAPRAIQGLCCMPTWKIIIYPHQSHIWSPLCQSWRHWLGQGVSPMVTWHREQKKVCRRVPGSL